MPIKTTPEKPIPLPYDMHLIVNELGHNSLSGTDLQEFLVARKKLASAQTEAERTYWQAGNFALMPAEQDEVLSAEEVTERLEIDHCVRMAPRLAEQAGDMSRDNSITYVANQSNALTTDTSHSWHTANRRVLTEQQALEAFQETIAELHSSFRGMEHFGRYADMAEGLLENLTFIGKKEYDEAVEGIAHYWKSQLDANADLQIYARMGETSEAVGGPLKSGEYLLDAVIAQFSDDELHTYAGRIVTHEADIRADDPENLKVVLLDDWTISGEQLRKSRASFLQKWPTFERSVEVQLIAAIKPRIALGLESISLPSPVRAYFVAHESTSSGQKAHITGFHSSVDYAFEKLIDQLIHIYNQGSESVANGTSEEMTMPPLTNIVRPYRMNGYKTEYEWRLRYSKMQ